MNNLFINPDNVNWQAHGVLAALRRFDGIECSWDQESCQYLAEPEVNPWFNGRERGYVISLRSINCMRRLNIVFFEHRNSDSICAVMFEKTGINPPNINDIPESHPFKKSKYDHDFSVSCGEFIKMSDWIMDRLSEFWTTTYNK